MSKKVTCALALILCVVAIGGCTKKVYTDPYGAGLGDLLNQATQDDIVRKYGPPTSKQTLSVGGEVWAYDYRSTTTSATPEQTSTATQCVRIIFVFDKDRVLRDYRRERC
ncbi:MAG TPA: hypothetical protein VLM38_09265 [Blastocatellia bacterium]|nr:hypothetical protein [Blastocatellia bacterium]